MRSVFARPGSFSEIQLQFQVDAAVDFEPRYNIAPTWSEGHEPPIVLINSHGQRESSGGSSWWNECRPHPARA